MNGLVGGPLLVAGRGPLKSSPLPVSCLSALPAVCVAGSRKRYGVRPSVWAFSRAAARGGFAEMGSRGRGSGPMAGDIARAAGECGQHRRKGFNISETGVEGMNPRALLLHSTAIYIATYQNDTKRRAVPLQQLSKTKK